MSSAAQESSFTATRRSASPVRRAGAAVVGLGAGAIGLWIAAHHPLAPGSTITAVLAIMAACARWPMLWLTLVPAALPWIGLAPWTGWIAFEEFDLLVLAAAAGAWLRLAAAPPSQSGRPSARDASALVVVAGLLWTTSIAIAAWRGVVDAGGWQFDWFAGYREPLNALRLAKPTIAVALLWPLWRHLQRHDDARASRALSVGFALGHAGAALACVWERAAFPGLTNFSTDYRTTALFWEMHVGGAALDGWLALSAPFAWQRLSRARGPLSTVLWAVVIGLGAYAALTTFSRILLVAVPLAVGVTALLGMRDAQSSGTAAVPSLSVTQFVALAIAAIVGIAAAAAIFPSSGYRGMIGLAGCMVLAPAFAAVAGAMSARERIAAAAVALLGAGAALLSPAIPKGPYLVDAVLLLLATAGLGQALRRRPDAVDDVDRVDTGMRFGLSGVVGTGAWGASCVGLVVVANHWGGRQAASPAAAAAGACSVVALALALTRTPRRDARPPALRTQAGFALTVLVGLAAVGVLQGGGYLSSRLDAATFDESSRWSHWRSSLARWPNETSRWLGVGLGRYLEHFAMSPDGVSRPGDMRRVVADDGRPHVRLANGGPPVGWGELLRLSQRIAPLRDSATVMVEARSRNAGALHVEVCAKHLLYDDGCRTAALKFNAPTDRWQTVRAALDGPPIGAAPPQLPRFATLSLAAPDADQLVEIRAVSLVEAGRERLVNGNFNVGLTGWFITSDRNHMPWHAKNMLVHVLFEQGIFGAIALGLLVAGAIAALLAGAARHHPLAAPLTGAAVGITIVGMVDSLLDIPRLAAMLLLLLVVAPTLAAQAQRAPGKSRHARTISARPAPP